MIQIKDIKLHFIQTKNKNPLDPRILDLDIARNL